MIWTAFEAITSEVEKPIGTYLRLSEETRGIIR